MYKVGDKVKIKPKSWFMLNCLALGRAPDTYLFANGISVILIGPSIIRDCEKELTIREVAIINNEPSYYLEGRNNVYKEWMFEPVADYINTKQYKKKLSR